VHRRFLTWLEGRGLDRQLESLPEDEELAARLQAGVGLTSPELSVLNAYSKITLSDDLLASRLPDDEQITRGPLAGYFPAVLVERFGDRITAHPLRREITANVLANELVNDCGITFVFRAQEELGVSTEEICRAYLVVREVFTARSYFAEVEALDGAVPSVVQTDLRLAYRRLLDRAVRWFVQAHPGALEAAPVKERYAPAVREMSRDLSELLVGDERKALQLAIEALQRRGVTDQLAAWAAGTLYTFQALDVADLAASLGLPLAEVAEVYFASSERLRVDAMLERISSLPRDDRWQALARASLRFDLYAVLDELTRAVLTWSHDGETKVSVEGRLAAWEKAHADAVQRALRTIDDVLTLQSVDLAALSVALRTLRGVVSHSVRTA
jgi:glutamate dehydrogenase